jgi:hypothetical protein
MGLWRVAGVLSLPEKLPEIPLRRMRNGQCRDTVRLARYRF